MSEIKNATQCQVPLHVSELIILVNIALTRTMCVVYFLSYKLLP